MKIPIEQTRCGNCQRLIEGTCPRKNRLNTLVDRSVSSIFAERCGYFESEHFVSKLNLTGKEEEEFRRNLRIAGNIVDLNEHIANLNSRRITYSKRFSYAVYRLYRNYGLSPKDIADFLGIGENTVSSIIGRVFSELCHKRKCELHRFLFRPRRMHEARSKHS